MRRCCGRFWRKCKPSRFAVSENQPYGRRPVGSPRDGLCPGIGSWGRNLAHECRWEVKCPCASPDFGIRHRIRVGRRALEFIWIRKPLNCVKPTDYRVGVEKWGLGNVRKGNAASRLATRSASRFVARLVQRDDAQYSPLETRSVRSNTSPRSAHSPSWSSANKSGGSLSLPVGFQRAPRMPETGALRCHPYFCNASMYVLGLIRPAREKRPGSTTSSTFPRCT